MFSLSALKLDLQTAVSLQLVAQSYKETAAGKLKRIRDEIQRNRSFYNEVSVIYRTVRVVAAKEYGIFRIKNNKILSILITPNDRFYGTLTSKVVNFFLENAKTSEDKVVIGKTGQDIIKTMHPIFSFKPFVTKGELPDNKELADLAELALLYKQVLVFYPTFKTILEQETVVKDITETIERPMREELEKNPLEILFGKIKSGSGYILEPEADKILMFFDTQVLALLLEAAFLDSELARTSARLVSMEQAESRAGKSIKDKQIAISLALRSLKNKHLLEAY
ncbi:MAG: F0F1 ATP synthase subunit gamma [Candidatus Blackburnbacteria bacterium]|nr:F0F1 ATP synthase subunit gamma [Candidatus Blackburnbacteria bacterium]